MAKVASSGPINGDGANGPARGVIGPRLRSPHLVCTSNGVPVASMLFPASYHDLTRAILSRRTWQGPSDQSAASSARADPSPYVAALVSVDDDMLPHSHTISGPDRQGPSYASYPLPHGSAPSGDALDGTPKSALPRCTCCHAPKESVRLGQKAAYADHVL